MPMPPYLLVIEPDFRTLKQLRVLLQGQRHTVRTADSAVDALVMLAGSRPALVIVDLALTDAEGRPFVQRIRDSHDLADLPIIALAEPTLACTDGRVAGCTAVVTRPIDPEPLAGLVRRLLDEADGR